MGGLKAHRRFGNVVEGLVIKSINKLVQTDITYVWVKDRFYYQKVIIDVYTRVMLIKVNIIQASTKN